MTKDKLGDLIIQSWDSLYRISRTILSSDADCEDAVSAMIVTCFSKIYQLREDRYAKTWMIRTFMPAFLRKNRQTRSEKPLNLREAVCFHVFENWRHRPV